MDDRMKDAFFTGMVHPARLTPQRYRSHPGIEVLQAYLAGALPGGSRLQDPRVWSRFRVGTLSRWHSGEVSLHVLTCPECAEQLAKWRAAQLISAPEGAKRKGKGPLPLPGLLKRLGRAREQLVLLPRRPGFYVALGSGFLIATLFILEWLWSGAPPLRYFSDGSGLKL